LVALDGEFTNASLELFSQAGGEYNNTTTGLTGDNAALLADGWFVPDVPGRITIQDLDPGIYLVTIYGAVGENTDGLTAGGSWDDGTGNIVTDAFGATGFADGFLDGETHFTEQFISTADDGSLAITFSGGINQSNGTVTGLQIEQIPEPGSLALLGLGSMALIRRRRR